MNPEIFKMMARGLKETPVAVSVPTSQEGRPKACYENSLVYMIGAKSMEYKYVLGIVDFRGVPIEHAWVKKDDGSYHEPTVIENKEMIYYPVVELGMIEVLAFYSKYDHPPEIYEIARKK